MVRGRRRRTRIRRWLHAVNLRSWPDNPCPGNERREMLGESRAIPPFPELLANPSWNLRRCRLRSFPDPFVALFLHRFEARFPSSRGRMYRRGELGQVARALRVLDGLRGFKRGRHIAELADEVGTSERTVRRDLAELIEAGYDIDRAPLDGRAAARLVERSYSTIPITRRERYTLLAIRSMFDVLRGTPLGDDVDSILRKLEQRLSPEERAEHATFGDRFAYIPDGGTKAYEGKEDILDALLTGVLSRKVVRFEYVEARGRTQRGHLAAYAMVLYKHGLYVIGRRLKRPEDGTSIPSDGGIGVYAAERFASAEQLRHFTFTPPHDFRLPDLFHGAFGIHIGDASKLHQVEIDFTKSKATYARSRTWHPAQRFVELRDGSARLGFPCTDLRPVVSWVLEWGPHARVVSPPELVELVAAEARATSALYR